MTTRIMKRRMMNWREMLKRRRNNRRSQRRRKREIRLSFIMMKMRRMKM
jgi:hypothetical protein